MSTTARRVFIGLTSVAFRRGLITPDSLPTVSRLSSLRALALASPRLAKTADEEKHNRGPIKFSTSKASHRTWHVDRSMGSQYQRPWWKVLPISLLTITFIVWCALRGDSEFDAKLNESLPNRHIPGLIPVEDVNKSS